MIRKNRLFFLMTFVFILACQNEAPPIDSQVPRPVRTLIVKTTGGDLKATFNGVATAGKASSLSFKVSGTIAKIPVNVGDEVKKGQPLAKLDPIDFDVEYRSAIANLKNAQANAMSAETQVNTSRSNYARVEKLYESGSVALSEFEQAKGNFETALAQKKAAQAQIATAQSQVQAAKNQRDYAILNAPYDGIITRIMVEENEGIGSGKAVMTLSTLDHTEIEVNLSDRYIALAKPETAVTVNFPTLGNRQLRGQVSEISYAANDDATYPVVVQLDESSSALRPGMAANVTFDFDNGNGAAKAQIYLPATAIGEDNQGNFVYVIDKTTENQGVAKRRTVTLGELTANGFEVQSGVEVGEIVATSGLQVLLEDMAVKL